MKKGLSLVLSTAMAVSMFASVAMAETATTTTTTTNAATEAAKVKTSADFKDLSGISAELKTKIDALLAKGVFDGVSEDSFGIDQNMTRAQAAKVLTLIYGIKVDDSVKTSSFSDVKADDSANGWAIPYIEAAKKAGLVDGVTDSTFVPGQNVTLGQFATMLVKGLGKTVDVTGTPWYKDAVAQAIALKILPEGTDGAKAATRGDLVVGAFGGQAAHASLNEPAKVSVKEVKATGAKLVQVSLDRKVDASKATLTLKRGTTEVKTTAKFDADNKTATLTLTDTKLTAGEYNVTLAGVDASEIENATAKFTAEDEAVKKIEFINPSDTIAYAEKVRVPFQATNQYGEATTLGSGSFSVFATAGDPVIKKTSNGDLYVELATKVDTIAQNVSQVSINIYDTNHNMSVQKVFKVGTAPYISKIELIEPEYQNGKTALNDVGDTVKVTLKEYDQYGSVMSQDSKAVNEPTALITPNMDTFENVVFEWNNDKMRVAKVVLKKKPDGNGEATLSVYGGSSAATAKIKLSAAKVATKVELTNEGTFAEGDEDKYVTLVAYDADGNKLSADDIVDNAKDKKFTINVSGAFTQGTSSGVLVTNGGIVTAGEHKGKIHIKSVTKGTGYVFAAIYTTNGQNSTAQQTFNVSGSRYPVSATLASDMPTKAVVGTANVEAKGKVKIFDQNNVEFKKGETYSYIESGRTVTSDVYVTITKSDAASPIYAQLGDLVLSDKQSIKDFDKVNDKDLKIIVPSGALVGQTFEVKLSVRKMVNDSLKDESVAFVSKKLTVVDPKKETLNYSVDALNTGFAAIDDGTYKDADGTIYDSITASKQHKEVKLIAKDNGGNKVAIDYKNMVTSVTSSVYNVARTAIADDKTPYVLGNKPGTATISLVFNTAKGETQTVSGEFVVKNDPVVVETIKAGKASVSDKTEAEIIATRAGKLMDLSVKDQYGIEYKDGNGVSDNNIYLYDKHLGVRYGVSEKQGSGTVTIANDGKITISGTVDSFVITAYANNLKSATTSVVIKK